MTTFTTGEDRWRSRLGTLRQVVRQEVVTRQLASHLPAGGSVLDVGCGQGTQALRLARLGHRVTGLDSSATLLSDFSDALAAEEPDVRARVDLMQGDARHLPFPARSFDLVLCHGVLMYYPDPAPLLAELANVVAVGGLVSLLVRNGDGLAMRPGLLGDWTAPLDAFSGESYDNRIGVTARADRLGDLTDALAAQGLVLRAWYGVRVFTDHLSEDAPLPDEQTLAALLECEERAGATDPYRQVAALTHVITELP
ncbi:SAM-dependent methyltransferase [Saccharothrix sp. ALI-22-I]|uniref:class I SAM-dependent methyltransferase n=1 Tax=Saccharothrix sp. ALI-22-I TaxID=1933778 RepID=UPI00097C2B4A|nr:class I SAM-dependent methyltransferase [Saccharothrix sp. ALI-22-I]ONI80659.1 SAM-dependent methyltransferase [Saccharothrix sp. ALI-22-I]